MKIRISAVWDVEVDTIQEGRDILTHLENEAAKKNCEIWDSGLTNSDTDDSLDKFDE